MFADRLAIDARSAIAAGPLAPLADSLAADLDRFLPDEDVFVPAEKAKMTRHGGRCRRDGVYLEFDPRSPHRHRCPACGEQYEGDDHYRWWVMGYQLWLAERAVHAAALWRVRGTDRFRRLADSILTRLADRYLTYPNEDNVLGPTRVFFSTYLESIWLLQVATAVSLLERDAITAIGGQVRDRILAPSSELVSSYNEGLSNRQVWNDAAMAAAGLLLNRPALVHAAFHGSGGLRQFLRSGLLDDGSWYEGENYHLFAHRGLWYLVRMAEQADVTLPLEATERFNRGYTAPLKTALPDFTFPARRDAQYRASLRQWRVAESLELGLSRMPASAELAAGLHTMYGDAPSGDSARWRSTAEAERNVPGVRLTRADLGWKSLLFALPELPAQRLTTPGSALMAGQGFAVIRQDEGRVYAALDYGHTGGSHGHPDRLNVWLITEQGPILEDVGTGSYVDRTLHWYRSTLAHNAPLVDGRSQEPVAGSLRAWDDHGGLAWVDAEAPVSPGVLVRRTVVVGNGHLVDRLEWTAERTVTLDLPVHVEGDVEGAIWMPATMTGESGLEDGFSFLTETETTGAATPPALVGAPGVNGFVHVDVPHSWWRATAPGPPGQPARKFLIVRARGSAGRILSVWSWAGPIGVNVDNDVLAVTLGDRRFTHRLLGSEWRVRADGSETTLGGRRDPGAPPPPDELAIDHSAPELVPLLRDQIEDLTGLSRGLRFELGFPHYRRSESTWQDAGSPTATVMIGATNTELLIDVTVNNPEPNFSPARDENPLDNEHPDVNSDGVQIHLTSHAKTTRPLSASWLLVPEVATNAVRISSHDDASRIPLSATWRQSGSGWQLLARLDRSAMTSDRFGLDVIVNEMPRGRERRRGQLVLSGAESEWAYLRGDRQTNDRLIPLAVQDG